MPSPRDRDVYTALGAVAGILGLIAHPRTRALGLYAQDVFLSRVHGAAVHRLEGRLDELAGVVDGIDRELQNVDARVHRLEQGSWAQRLTELERRVIALEPLRVEVDPQAAPPPPKYVGDLDTTNLRTLELEHLTNRVDVFGAASIVGGTAVDELRRRARHADEHGLAASDALEHRGLPVTLGRDPA